MASSSGYRVRRDLHDTVRLNFQHWVTKRVCNGLIHPSITLRSPAFVADLGTGSAIWPIEVAEQMEATGINATIDGFDISSDQFPPSKLLPTNIHLHVQDAFSTFPPEFISRFDLVSIRGFVSFTRLPEAEKLLHNVSQILKPGGYLQWVDLNPHDTRIVRSDNVIATPRLDQTLEGIRRPVKDADPVFTFLPNLATLAQTHHLHTIHNGPIPTTALDQHFLNQSIVSAFEDSVMSSAKAKGLEAVVGAEVWMEELLAEIRAGSHIRMELFWFVARKVEG